jgi:uncharacterized protein (TIGR01777 family)
VLSRDGERAQTLLRAPVVGWQPAQAPAPATALSGCDGVVNLVGENIAQRWTARAKRAIRDSRVAATANLVAGLRAADPRPRVLVSASAVGYYGDRGDERLDEESTPGGGFLAQLCVDWEAAAAAARELGMRVVNVRTGVVLDRSGGALPQLLGPFKLGLGGPVAGGRQYMPWIQIDDVVGIYAAALHDERWQGPVNATAPEPVTNAEFAKALGRALHRPAIAPLPGVALRLALGEMASVIIEGQRAVPARALALGYEHAHQRLDEALAAALA